MNQQAIYRSIWEEGTVETDCEVTPSGEIIHIDTVEPQFDAQHLKSEEVEIKFTGHVFDVIRDSDQELVITLQKADAMSPDSELTVGFYNRGNYESFEAAKKEGADYYVPSSISLYGHSGIMDLKEIVDALIQCIGCGDDYRCVVKCPSGKYIDSDVAETYFSNLN